MASNTISILIQAQDNASKVIRSVGENVDSAGNKASGATPKFGSLSDHLAALATISISAGLATHSLIGLIEESVGSANKLQAALTGLNSVASAFGQNADAAKKAAQELASDGLMTVADSATGLKNLLASGFSLDQAITLMKRFKDSAAFGRQSALSFGEAISSATEGIKNGNSILVDNAGVTKNLSVMLTEAGFSAQDLMNATSDASIRQALFNGILKETNAQAGDAAKLAESAAGKQAVWTAQTEILRQKIGTALQPALLKLLETVTPIITAIAGWVEQNPQLAAGILIATTALVGLVTVVGGLALAVTALGPVFALFSSVSTLAIGGVGTAFTALSALVAVPLVLPAIGVAAALAALALVVVALQSISNAVAAVNDASKQVQATTDATAQLQAKYEAAKKTGDKALIDKTRKNYLNALDTDIQIYKQGASARAIGTNYASGGPTIVGEHGAELVNLPQGSSVTPAWQTRSQGASNSPSVVIQNFHSYSQQDNNRFFRDLGFYLELAS